MRNFGLHFPYCLRSLKNRKRMWKRVTAIMVGAKLKRPFPGNSNWDRIKAYVGRVTFLK